MSETKDEVKLITAVTAKILLAERNNLRTKAKTNDEMVEQIARIIKNEYKRNY